MNGLALTAVAAPVICNCRVTAVTLLRVYQFLIVAMCSLADLSFDTIPLR